MAPSGERASPSSRAGADGTVRTFVSPDIATCDDCLAELFDPADRRYRYPFINCTNCGPRFTITLRLPYDRPNTTMAASPCARPAPPSTTTPPTGASTPSRWPAPIAARVCGSSARPGGSGRGPTPPSPAAQAALARGEIVAIKGLGGYHLACDARLRRGGGSDCGARKHRGDKPFAVMVRDLDAAARPWPTSTRPKPAPDRRHSGPSCSCAGAEARAAWPSRRRWRRATRAGRPAALHAAASPALRAGARVRRPAPVPDVLVMTSGNLTDEPICFDDDDARGRLGAIADAWLLHDRPIHVPCDDSVLRIDPRWERAAASAFPGVRAPARPAPVRGRPHARGRGRAEEHVLPGVRPRRLDEPAHRRHGQPRDAGPPSSVDPAVRRDVRDPDAGARGRRPSGLPDAAVGRGSRPARPVAEVQHHHAHIASVMAEHGVPAGRRVIGFAFDGTVTGPTARSGAGRSWSPATTASSASATSSTCRCRVATPPSASPTVSALAHLWAAGIDWAAGPAAGRRRARRQERAVLAAPARARDRLRADIEHGPALRCGELAARRAPQRDLRGAGGHGACSGRPKRRRRASQPYRTAST